MKKTLFVLIMLSLSISCQKPDADTEPVETSCLIQKITYDDGYYEIYKFDANNRLASTILTYEDNGKMIEVPLRYEYNTAGNLIKTIADDGYVDEYIYDVNGLLTRVDFKDPKGGLSEQFTVTMDAQKRVTKIVLKNDGSVATYEYNGPNGALSKSEAIFEGKILDQYVISEYVSDATKKSYDITIKGHPFDPAAFTNQIIYSEPFNFGPRNSMVTKGKIATQFNEDWSELTDKTRVYYDFTATRKYNSNNFTIERASADAIEKKTYLKTFSYSNCN